MTRNVRTEAMRRVALRALAGAEALAIEPRIQLFEDVASMLQPDEGEAAKLIAFALREALSQQQDFFSKLKLPTTEAA